MVIAPIRSYFGFRDWCALLRGPMYHLEGADTAQYRFSQSYEPLDDIDLHTYDFALDGPIW